VPNYDRILRCRLAALAAHEKVMTARYPQYWRQIAEAWDQLAMHFESLELPLWRENQTRGTGNDANRS
jgi:hypothetical protein